jgi:tight adherence protein B
MKILLGASLAGAVALAVMLIAPDRDALLGSLRQALRDNKWLERVRVDLAQAELADVPALVWVAVRVGAAVLIGLAVLALFHLLVLAAVASLAVYHLGGLLLERRRRNAEERRQRALLDAVAYGASVMARAGSATQMIEALATSGPLHARRLFAEILVYRDSANVEASLLAAVERIRERLADPLFDDVALALNLHWRKGGRLVPALEALNQEWEETLRLQREARALRAGVAASVILLTLLPFIFLMLLQALAPSLLAPLRTASGEALFAVAVGWMVLGHRVLQRMSEPPREERLQLSEAA